MEQKICSYKILKYKKRHNFFYIIYHFYYGQKQCFLDILSIYFFVLIAIVTFIISKIKSDKIMRELEMNSKKHKLKLFLKIKFIANFIFKIDFYPS